jgi:hypothetical protein
MLKHTLLLYQLLQPVALSFHVDGFFSFLIPNRLHQFLFIDHIVLIFGHQSPETGGSVLQLLFFETFGFFLFLLDRVPLDKFIHSDDVILN